MNYLVAVAGSSRTELEVLGGTLYSFKKEKMSLGVADGYRYIAQLPHPENPTSSHPWWRGGVWYAVVAEETIKERFPNGYEVRPNAIVYKLEN